MSDDRRPPTVTSAVAGRTHAVISGTGRAGTSFLVEYLAACGVPAGNLEALYYFAEADAGYERRVSDGDLPYLFKEPLLHEHLDEVEASGLTIEALIVPVRDLRQAAESRVLRERTRIAAAVPPAAARQTFSATPGGVVYSLSVDDQERILAVGQSRLLAWAVQRDVPLFLLGFPRLVEDAAHVVDTLWPWLQRFTDRDRALAEHARLAAPERVHVRPAEPVSAEDLRIENAALSSVIADLRSRLAGSDDLTFQVKVLRALERIERSIGSARERRRGA